MNDPSFRVKVEWMDIEEFLEEHGGGVKTGGRTSKPSGSIATPGTNNNVNNNTSKPSANRTSTKSVQNSNTSTKSAGSKDASAGNAKQATAATASKSSEPATDSIACGDCGKEFSSVESLNQHHGATGHSSFGCPVCNKIFTSLKALTQHTGSSKCGNGQTNKQASKPNTTSNNSANQKAAGNDNKEGGGRRNRKQAAAQEEVSSDEEVWVCGECQREFASEEGCAQHQRATGHVDPECGSCGKCFNSQTSMEQHCRSTGHFPLVNPRANNNVFGFGTNAKLPVASNTFRPDGNGGYISDRIITDRTNFYGATIFTVGPQPVENVPFVGVFKIAPDYLKTIAKNSDKKLLNVDVLECMSMIAINEMLKEFQLDFRNIPHDKEVMVRTVYEAADCFIFYI